MPAPRKHRYRVGDKVRFQFGGRTVTATVIEDRGGLGHRGEQVVRVAMPVDVTYHAEFELSASLVEPVPQKRAKGSLAAG